MFHLDNNAMNTFANHYNLYATLFFGVVIALAHAFALDSYSIRHNTISDLAAQGYSRKMLMQIGFIGFGGLIVLGVCLHPFSWRRLPIALYGFSVACSGVFCTKPFEQLGVLPYSSTESSLHSIFAQVAGIALSCGVLLQILFAGTSAEKLLHLVAVVLIIGLSAAFGLFDDIRGILQRILYLVSLLWFVRYYTP